MVVVVLAAQVVHVAGGHERPAELLGDLDDALVGLVLVGHAVLLHLEVDVVGPEHLHELVGVGAGVGGVAVHEPLAEARLQAAGQHDHALGVLREHLHVHVRLAALEAVEEAGRRQLHEVAEALVVAGQQREVVALVAHGLGADVVDEVGLEAHDRLDAVLAGGLVVLDGAVHDPVVGEPEGGLAEARGALGERVDLARAVEHRVLGVHMKVDAGRLRHRGQYRPATGPLPGPRRTFPAISGKARPV